jgi:hypothetical protein
LWGFDNQLFRVVVRRPSLMEEALKVFPKMGFPLHSI